MNLESAPSLTMATKIGDLSLIKLLVEMCAYYSTASGKSNLLYLSVPNLELMEFFLKLGIDINGNESDGVPLIKAICGMNFEAVKFLVDHKAELNQEFFFGSPLKQASECSDGHARDQYCSVENLLIINYLIKYGGSFNIDESNSALLAAVGRLDLSMVRNFLALGDNGKRSTKIHL